MKTLLTVRGAPITGRNVVTSLTRTFPLPRAFIAASESPQLKRTVPAFVAVTLAARHATFALLADDLPAELKVPI